VEESAVFVCAATTGLVVLALLCGVVCENTVVTLLAARVVAPVPARAGSVGALTGSGGGGLRRIAMEENAVLVGTTIRCLVVHTLLLGIVGESAVGTHLATGVVAPVPARAGSVSALLNISSCENDG
jgi:hypothetical protein